MRIVVLAGLLFGCLHAQPGNQAAPCKDPKNPEYRQFDFWIGEWDVFDPS